MDVYETRADNSGYFLFHHRAIKITYAHFHSAYEFIFMESGELEVVLDGKELVLHAGECLFVKSLSVHAYKSTGENKAYIILGDASCFKEYLSPASRETFPEVFAFDDFPFLQNLHDLCNGMQDSKGAYVAFRGAMKILAATLAQSVPFVRRTENKDSALICKVLRYAQTNPQADLTLGSLGNAFSYSKEHLSRVIHKYLRENWNTYVNRLRVHAVKKMMDENGESASVTQFVYDCGFESLSTFYRAYKREFGVAPKNDV
ncbi:MAG: AraC family transcriptional regulator [Clostridiales bacterium]|nr:AraC family transcriptional regulator [Clostridiales bacterium]